MSEAIAFDTHRFVKRLTEHGFTEEQAEALANGQVALPNGNLATKADVKAVRRDVETLRQKTKAGIEAMQRDIEPLRHETKAGIEALRQWTRADVATLEADLLKWMLGAMIAQGLIVALVKLP